MNGAGTRGRFLSTPDLVEQILKSARDIAEADGFCIFGATPEWTPAIGKVLGRERVAKLPQPLCIMKAIVPLLQKLPFFPITMDQVLMLVEENICDGAWRDTFRFEPERFAGGIARYLRP